MDWLFFLESSIAGLATGALYSLVSLGGSSHKSVQKFGHLKVSQAVV